MNNLVDQIKYENIDLKLKLDEYSEVNEQNVSITSCIMSYSYIVAPERKAQLLQGRQLQIEGLNNSAATSAIQYIYRAHKTD